MAFEIVSVVGLGYIGLPTAAMFASFGKQVIGVDVNQQTIDTISRGEIHIVEPELDKMVYQTVKNGRLSAVLTPQPADAFLIAVPTPFIGDEHLPDLSFIEKATNAIGAVLKKGDLVVLESTSPVGTTEKIAEWLTVARPDLTFPISHGESSDIRIAHCPERVLPGHVVRELVENDRVIGGITAKCSAAAVELYKTFVKGECVVTNARTAEMAKLTENACRDVNIAFANELSMICDELDINVWELISLANRHPRINILQPGPGVGGHCIAVDPWFIISRTPKQANLVRAARLVNDSKPQWVLDKVKIALSEYLQQNVDKSMTDVTIACFGLTFKPDIDDLRESPALDICNRIAQFHNGNVIATEPNIRMLPTSMSSDIELVDCHQAINVADILVLLVDHKEFKAIDIHSTQGKILVDTKGIWSQVKDK